MKNTNEAMSKLFDKLSVELNKKENYTPQEVLELIEQYSDMMIDLFVKQLEQKGD